MKQVARSARASNDIEDAVHYYAGQAVDGLVVRFLDAMEAALDHVATHPGTGSRRYAQHMPQADLRFWTLNHFPYSVFYVERKDLIDVIRVLHQASDIPNHLTTD